MISWRQKMLQISRYFRCYFMVAVLWLIFIFVYFMNGSVSNVEPDPIEVARKCYLHDGRNPNGTGKSITYFEDLFTSKQPEFDQGIFFIETQCSDNGIADIKPRHACSIESAAKANPTRDVFVIYASPVGLPRHEQNWSTTIKALKTYPNIHFRNVQLKQLCYSTPLEDWIETSALFKSIARYEHASDVIRALLLYKFGGTYMDMDFVTLRSLDTISRNWIPLQHEDEMSNAVIDFRHSGIGNIVINEILSDLAENFNPDAWGSNGPYCFERVMRKICDTEDLTKVSRAQCRGAKVYPPDMFYPLYGPDSPDYFNPDAAEAVLGKMKDVLGFHYYNSHTKDTSLHIGSGAAFDLMAKEHCPRVYVEHDEF